MLWNVEECIIIEINKFSSNSISFLDYLEVDKDFLSKQIQILFQMNFSRRQGSPQALLETQC